MGTTLNRTPYEILEVPETISYPDLRRSFRDIIHKYSKNQISAEEYRLKIRAYETLSDYEKRAKYDSCQEWAYNLPLNQYTTQQLAAEPDLVETLKDRLRHSTLTEINSRDPITDQTILYVSARAGNLPAVQFLIEYGAEPDLPQRIGSTALHVASFYGHSQVVRCLLEAGANYRILNAGNATAEYEAYDSDVTNVFVELKQSPYIRAAANEIEWFSNNNLVQHIDEEYFGQRQTLLHCASKKGHFDLVRFFVEILSANINTVDINGNSALHLAVCGHHVEIVSYLLNKGCNPTLQNRWGLTAEQEDTKRDDRIKDIFQEMRTRDMFEMACKGIDWWFQYYFGSTSPDTVDAEGVNLLYHACHHGQNTIVKWLLEHKADVNTQIQKAPKHTCLHVAKFCGHLKIVKLLLEYGADITIKNDINRTAFEQGFSKNVDRDVAQNIHDVLFQHKKDLIAYKLIDVHIYLDEDQDDEPKVKIRMHHASTYYDLLRALPSSYSENKQIYFSIARRFLNFDSKETKLLSAIYQARYLESKLIETPLCLTLHTNPPDKTHKQKIIRSDPILEFCTFINYFEAEGKITRFQLKPSKEKQTVHIGDLAFTFFENSIVDNIEFEVRTLFSIDNNILDLPGCICLFETSLYKDTPKLLELPIVSYASDCNARLYTLAISTPYWFTCNTRQTRLPMLDGIHVFIQHINVIPTLLTLPIDMIMAASMDRPLTLQEQPVKCTCLSLQKHDTINFQEIAYHGTNISLIRSILFDGLAAPGTVVNCGKRVTRAKNHMRRSRQVFDIPDFVDAIFVSPSLHYSCDSTYAIPFPYGNQQVLPILECSVKKNSYSSFPCTVPTYKQHSDDNIKTIEWRIIDPQNIMINAVLFIPTIDSLEATKEIRLIKIDST